MRIVSINYGGAEQAALVAAHGVVPLQAVNEAEGASWSLTVFELLQHEEWDRLKAWYDEGGKARVAALEPLAESEFTYAALYRQPRKIWGIGMNYVQKAVDLASTPPDMEPVCFMKPDTTLIGPGESIVLPAQSERVTAEAEIGIIIGRVCKDVEEADIPSIVAGLTPTLDMTAQDIHAKNPRFLSRSKCFDTFFSFGPELVTVDEVADIGRLTLQTGLNGEVTHSNTVDHMIYRLWFIVSYFSKMMTLLPGDIIMTGTPGSTLIRSGDTAECRIDGFRTLANPVRA